MTDGVPLNRTAITASIMLATSMTMLDSTIVNVALPHIQGSLSATPDQITWLLTSYMVAMAIATPLSGWMAGRIGLKHTILLTVAGFTVASMLCGIATGLAELVFYRLLQGLFGAALIPLSQTVLFNINPPERHAQAMAIWSSGSLIGPIMGPILGGYLTETFSWRWCFYINLPIGLLALAGVMIFMPKEDESRRRPFDALGFSALAIGLSTLQLMLDRGSGEDWFTSPEIWTYAVIFAGCAWVYVAHTLTAAHPFFDAALFRNRNLIIGCLFSFYTGAVMFASSALVPIIMQTLMGYPPILAGLMNLPRGLGMLASAVIAGRLASRMDLRLLLLLSILIGASGVWMMTYFDLMMDDRLILLSGFLQGFGTAMFFVPITALAFVTVGADIRAEASALFNMVRNIGASVGIALLQAQAVANTRTLHEAMAGRVAPEDQVLSAALPAAFSPATVAGRFMLDGEISRQAMMAAYVNDFRALLIGCALVIPLILLLQAPKGGASPGAATMAVD